MSVDPKLMEGTLTPEHRAKISQACMGRIPSNRCAIEVEYIDGNKVKYPSFHHVPEVTPGRASEIQKGKRNGAFNGIKRIVKI